MTHLEQIIRQRRSVRRFQDREVPEALLRQVLEAVRWAPSWANTQCWEVVVVKDMQIKKALAETVSAKNPATRAVSDAPVVLALCARLKRSGYYKDQVTTKFGDWFMFDLGLAAQNLCLAAHDLGLGTVIVGLFDHDRAARVLKAPEGVEVVALIPLGYPAKPSRDPGRREIAEFTHLETF